MFMEVTVCFMLIFVDNIMRLYYLSNVIRKTWELITGTLLEEPDCVGHRKNLVFFFSGKL